MDDELPRLTRRQLLAGGFGLLAAGATGFLLEEAWEQLRREDLIPGVPPEVPLQPRAWSTSPDEVAFAVIGDNGSGGRQAMAVAEQLALSYRREPFGLLSMLGDIVYYGPIERRFRDVFLQPLGPLVDAGVRFEVALGNHDNAPLRGPGALRGGRAGARAARHAGTVLHHHPRPGRPVLPRHRGDRPRRPGGTPPGRVARPGAVGGLLALAHLGALVAPAAVLAVTADKGGLPRFGGYDLLVASTVVGFVHAVVVAVRLHRAHREVGLTNALLAGLDGLFVVLLLATGLLFVVLGAQGPVGAVLVNEGLPLLALWVGVQVVAVLLGEATQWAVARWLARDPDAPAQGA